MLIWSEHVVNVARCLPGIGKALWLLGATLVDRTEILESDQVQCLLVFPHLSSGVGGPFYH